MRPYIKSSIIIAVIAFVFCFFIWTIMWEKQDAGKYEVDQLSDRVNQQIDVNNKNIIPPKEKIKDTRQIDDGEPEFVEESRTPKKQLGKTQAKREDSEDMKVDISMQLPRKETKLSFAKETDGSIDYDNHEHIDLKKKNYIKSDPNKTISITKNNNITSITIINKNPVTQKNTPTEQPIEALYLGVENNSQHATSTAPTWQ